MSTEIFGFTFCKNSKQAAPPPAHYSPAAHYCANLSDEATLSWTIIRQYKLNEARIFEWEKTISFE